MSNTSDPGRDGGAGPVAAVPEGASAEAEADLLIGTVLAGRYRILQKLGEGAMGTVYLGEHVKIGRRDAIKVLRGPLVKDAEAIARFNRGARNVAAIQHPNVCTIYDYSDTDDGLPFLAMEFIPGESLKDLLDREGPLPVGRTVRITRQVAAALYAAHNAGIVHRDLKPGNVMLMHPRDGVDEVRVVDFDIAKGSQEGEESEVTRLGFVIGTPEYMSPEQLMAERLDGRSDVYSLGILVFRMLTGALPFQGSTPHEIVFQRLTNPPLRLEQVRPDLSFPPKLQAVLERALQRSPADRHPSAAEFARELVEATAAVAGAPKQADFQLSATGIIPAHVPVGRRDRDDVPETRLSEAVAPETVTSPQAASLATPRPATGSRRTHFATAGTLALAALLGVGWFAIGRNARSVDPPIASEATLDTPPLLARVGPDEEFPATEPTEAPVEAPAEPATPPRPSPATPDAREVTTPPPPERAPVEPTPTQPEVTAPPRESLEAVEAWLREARRVPDSDVSPAQLLVRRDRASEYYRRQDLSTELRALAAYVAAGAWQYQGNNAQCRTWAQRALQLNRTSAYSFLHEQCSAGY